MSSPTDPELLAAYAGKGVLLDSNLLLLLVVGMSDRQQVARFKRLNIFAVEDFDLLVAITAAFRHVYVTPNVVTEVSNLAGALFGESKRRCFEMLRALLQKAEELIIESRVASEHDMFVEFGVTDAVLGICAGDPPLVLTVDFPLARILAARGRPVVNVNHLRHRYWNTEP